MVAAVVLLLAAAPLFDSDAVLDVVLDGPIAAVVDAKQEPGQEFDFTLSVAGASQPLKVRARGNSRLRVCAFPPLRLNFPAAASGVFAGQDKLKLVSHCRGSKAAEEDLLEEYAVYRMFAQLSEQSLRVRLLRVEYRDGGEPVDLRYAFLLESEAALAGRLQGALFTGNGVALAALDQAQAALVYVFHYFIGNTDWSLVTADGDTVCCHNGILVERDGAPAALVPYDFDLSGFVDAPYAKPDPSLRIGRVTIRRYRGYCTGASALRDAIDRIVEGRESLAAVIDALPLLSEADKARRKRYLERFYKEAATPERLLAAFERRCL